MKRSAFKGKEWKSHFPLLTLPSFHLWSLSQVSGKGIPVTNLSNNDSKGFGSAKLWTHWLQRMWTLALACSWQVPSPASPHCLRTVLVTTYGGRRGAERAGGAHTNNHPSFDGRDLLGGELLPSACPQALPKAPHAADPGVNNTLGPEF